MYVHGGGQGWKRTELSRVGMDDGGLIGAYKTQRLSRVKTGDYSFFFLMDEIIDS